MVVQHHLQRGREARTEVSVGGRRAEMALRPVLIKLQRPPPRHEGLFIVGKAHQSIAGVDGGMPSTVGAVCRDPYSCGMTRTSIQFIG